MICFVGMVGGENVWRCWCFGGLVGVDIFVLSFIGDVYCSVNIWDWIELEVW